MEHLVHARVVDTTFPACANVIMEADKLDSPEEVEECLPSLCLAAPLAFNNTRQDRSRVGTFFSPEGKICLLLPS